MITIDARTASTGVDFELFIRGGFLTGTTAGGAPSWAPGPFSGEEMFFSFGTDPDSKYVLAHGEGITYDFASTHTVYGEAHVLEFGSRGSGDFNEDGFFVGGNIEVRISGLEMGNPIGDTAGPLNNFALAYLIGEMAPSAYFDAYADALDTEAQTFLGSRFADDFRGTGFADVLKGRAGADDFTGGDGEDLLSGALGDDRLLGEGDDDSILGHAGNDELRGGEGEDDLTGGNGKDQLFGGADADIFVFTSIHNSAVGQPNRDVIHDFSQADGDRIDFSALGELAFIGTDSFSGAGEVRYQTKQTMTLVAVDATADGKADMKIKLLGQIELQETDFIL